MGMRGMSGTALWARAASGRKQKLDAEMRAATSRCVKEVARGRRAADGRGCDVYCVAKV